MKVMLLSDTHLTNRRPVGRVDDYWATQMHKLDQIGTLYVEQGCECLLHAGDVFDKPSQPPFVVNGFVQFLNSYGITMHCVRGQHDLYNRSYEHLDKTSLELVIQASNNGLVSVLDPYKPLELILEDGHAFVWGASYKQDLDSDVLGDQVKLYGGSNAKHILVIHKEIGVLPLFPGHVLTAPRSIMAQYPFIDLILCGDYHYSFDETSVSGEQQCVNVGCLLRKTIFVRDRMHVPRVGILDLETMKITYHELKVSPAKEVFNQSMIEAAKGDGVSKFRDFGNALNGVREGALFLENLKAAMNHNFLSAGAVVEIKKHLLSLESGEQQ